MEPDQVGITKCPTCNGRGYKEGPIAADTDKAFCADFIETQLVECAACGGSGRQPRDRMTPIAFKTWRKAAGLSQAAAARALGISPRNVFAYEHGEKRVPLTVRLACAAYALGLRDYEGPL